MELDKTVYLNLFISNIMYPNKTVHVMFFTCTGLTALTSKAL